MSGRSRTLQAGAVVRTLLSYALLAAGCGSADDSPSSIATRDAAPPPAELTRSSFVARPLRGEAGATAAVDDGSIVLRAVPANQSVGLDWSEVEGALEYRVYVATARSADPTRAEPVAVASPSFVHTALHNGTTYRYVVTALLPGGETAPSNEVQATPGGEWMLEQLGSGLFDDVASGANVPRVPLEHRVHILLFAEGYTADDLHALHDAPPGAPERRGDVGTFIDQVFAIEPYSVFREAFVIWLLPRASAGHIGGNTAFHIPLVADRDYAVVDAVPFEGTTAAAAWAAIDALPIPPVDFYANYNQRARNHIAYFLMYEPSRARAGVSGRASGLTDSASGRCISTAFGWPFAHELTHAFGQLSDEYMDRNRPAGDEFGPTWNVIGSRRCADLPWRHLLAGSAINPSARELVGAFGVPGLGFHPELRCLMNGSQHNADYFGGTGDLRSDDRLCNFCREMTAFRVLERTSVLPDTLTSFDTWARTLRGPFYRRFGFAVPEQVPQLNDAGDPVYEACDE